jgi:hypothetical protein
MENKYIYNSDEKKIEQIEKFIDSKFFNTKKNSCNCSDIKINLISINSEIELNKKNKSNKKNLNKPNKQIVMIIYFITFLFIILLVNKKWEIIKKLTRTKSKLFKIILSGVNYPTLTNTI